MKLLPRYRCSSLDSGPIVGGTKLALTHGMDGGFRFPSKPYEIRQRLRQFVLALIAVYPENPTWSRPSAQAWEQLFKAASSSGAHIRLEGWRTLGELPDEASQLVAILTTIVNNTTDNDGSH